MLRMNSSSFPALLKTFHVRTPPVFLLDPSIMFTFAVQGVGVGGPVMVMVVVKWVGGGRTLLLKGDRQREREMQCSFRWNQTHSQCRWLRLFVHGVHALPGEWCGIPNHATSSCIPFSHHSFLSLTSHCGSVCVPLIKLGLDRPDNSRLTFEAWGKGGGRIMMRERGRQMVDYSGRKR